VGSNTRMRQGWRTVLAYFGLRRPRRTVRPVVAVAFCALAIGWILLAALGSGSVLQWLLAAAWVLLAVGNVWEAYRGRSRPES
jgi:hypothetical protein